MCNIQYNIHNTHVYVCKYCFTSSNYAFNKSRNMRQKSSSCLLKKKRRKRVSRQWKKSRKRLKATRNCGNYFMARKKQIHHEFLKIFCFFCRFLLRLYKRLHFIQATSLQFMIQYKSIEGLYYYFPLLY